MSAYASDNTEDLLRRYFYPESRDVFTLMPNQEQPLGKSTCSKEEGMILSVYKDMTVNKSSVVNQELYRYYFEGGKVISQSQIYLNGLTHTKSTVHDRLILFALPDGEKTIKWTERLKGEEYACTAEYVYIKFNQTGFSKAVKITRSTIEQGVEQQSVYKEWSYWLCDVGRIATLGQFKNGKVVISEMTKRCSKAFVEEISKEEFDDLQKEEEVTNFIDDLNNHKGRLGVAMGKANYKQFIYKCDSLVNDGFGEHPQFGTLQTASYSLAVELDTESRINLNSPDFDFPFDGTALFRYIQDLCRSGILKQEEVVEPITGRKFYKPLIEYITYTFDKRKIDNEFKLRKGKWVYADSGREIAKDIYPLVEYFANDDLAKSPNSKTVKVKVAFYYSQSGMIVIPEDK